MDSFLASTTSRDWTLTNSKVITVRITWQLVGSGGGGGGESILMFNLIIRSVLLIVWLKAVNSDISVVHA